MKKAYTVYLEPKTYENLKAFAEKKKWSLTQAMEYILQKMYLFMIKKQVV